MRRRRADSRRRCSRSHKRRPACPTRARGGARRPGRAIAAWPPPRKPSRSSATALTRSSSRASSSAATRSRRRYSLQSARRCPRQLGKVGPGRLLDHAAVEVERQHAVADRLRAGGKAGVEQAEEQQHEEQHQRILDADQQLPDRAHEFHRRLLWLASSDLSGVIADARRRRPKPFRPAAGLRRSRRSQ